ncbi:hypothetical protein G9P44_004440 [Scheffersomyces stipitis]|nr:hypothetical protein G9P44_004440 [Scheffersomyces stipitis]
MWSLALVYNRYKSCYSIITNILLEPTGSLIAEFKEFLSLNRPTMLLFDYTKFSDAVARYTAAYVTCYSSVHIFGKLIVILELRCGTFK